MKKAVDAKRIVKKPLAHRKDATNFVIFGMIVITLVLLIAMFVVQYGVEPEIIKQIQDNNSNNIYRPPGGTARLQILRPVNGDTISSSIIGIKVNVTNFQLVDIAANRPNVQNQGHLVYILDGTREIKSIYKDYSMANVPKGAHTLTVELRNNDNTPLVPPVTASVQVTVV